MKCMRSNWHNYFLTVSS